MLQACDEVCEKKKKVRGTMGLHGGEIKRRKQYNKRKGHIKRCAKINQRKTRPDMRLSKIEPRKWLLIL